MALRRTLLATALWFVLCNGWGLLLFMADHVTTALGLSYLAVTGVGTVALGTHLSRLRHWWLSFVLVALGAACATGWFLVGALFSQFSIQAVVGSVFGGVLTGLALTLLFALGWPIGAILRPGLADNRATAIRG